MKLRYPSRLNFRRCWPLSCVDLFHRMVTRFEKCHRRIRYPIIGLLFLLLPLVQVANAASSSTTTVAPITASPPPASLVILPTSHSLIPPAPQVEASAYILMDAKSGAILAEKNSNIIREPASLTKLMTLYVTFHAIQQGLIHIDDPVLISRQAWKTGGSKMFVKAGKRVSVDKLIQGVIVDSGNDASIALSEYVGGSIPGFVSMMNQQARVLGMTHTHFTDPTGLPASNHVTTAQDLARLTQALINHFPQYYQYFGQKWLTYNGIRQPNRNRLLWRYQGVDGLKTGHTDAAGFCLVASAQHNGMRLISVVMGAPSDQARTDDSIALLRYGFRFFDSYQLYSANQPIVRLRVWHGKKHQIPVGFTKDFIITLPHNALKHLQLTLQPIPLKAPVEIGQKAGELTVTLDHTTLHQVPVVVLETDRKGGVFRKIVDSIHHKLLRKHSLSPITLPLPETIRHPKPIVDQSTMPPQTASSPTKGT